MEVWVDSRSYVRMDENLPPNRLDIICSAVRYHSKHFVVPIPVQFTNFIVNLKFSFAQRFLIAYFKMKIRLKY